MQDRYVGDIGDFAKYGLLRALSEDRQLGVAWYLYPDETHNDHGMQIGYLCRPEVWRHLDPGLFDALEDIINHWQIGAGERTVAEIQNRNLLPGAVFADECLYPDLRTPDWCQAEVWNANWLSQSKLDWRTIWFERVMEQLAGCDIVYADPDNGLYSGEGYNAADPIHWKRLPLAEAQQLAEGRTAILYHHNTRFRGGNRAEIRHWLDQLPAGTYAYYWRRYGNRTFFVVNPDQQIRDRLTAFAERWHQHGELILPQG